MAIIGMTTRLDAYELLEKRIRSRMFYRKIIVTHPTSKQNIIIQQM